MLCFQFARAICLAGCAAAAAHSWGPLRAGTVWPTDEDQYLVELINRDRANPTAAAARFGVDLNEGLPAGTISSAPKQPLAINSHLEDSSTSHSQYMLANDVFSHYGPGGLNPFQRMVDAGYGAVNTFGAGENIAWQGITPGVPDVTDYVGQINANLFVDAAVADRGHRVNIMLDAYKEVGTGVLSGPFTSAGTTYSSVMITEDLAYRFNNPFLTGVAYRDADHNQFYTPGEALGGLTVVATRLSDHQAFATATWGSGGYSLQLAPGSYQVLGYGAGLGGTVLFKNVTIGGLNVKEDFLPSAVLAPGDANGDGVASGADYTAWADHFHQTGQNATTGDFNGDGVVDGADYTVWADHFTSAAAAPVPEPSTRTLAAIGLAACCLAWQVTRIARRRSVTQLLACCVKLCPQSHTTRREGIWRPQRGHAFDHCRRGGCGPATAILALRSARRTASARATAHCGWVPPSEYDALPQTGQ